MTEMNHSGTHDNPQMDKALNNAEPVYQNYPTEEKKNIIQS